MMAPLVQFLFLPCQDSQQKSALKAVHIPPLYVLALLQYEDMCFQPKKESTVLIKVILHQVFSVDSNPTMSTLEKSYSLLHIH